MSKRHLAQAGCRELLQQCIISDEELNKQRVDSYGHPSTFPPFESFAYDLSTERIDAKLKEGLQEGDSLYVKVSKVDAAGAQVYPLCFASRLKRDLTLGKTTFIIAVSSLAARVNVGGIYKVNVCRINPLDLQIEAPQLQQKDLPLYFRSSVTMESKSKFMNYIEHHSKYKNDNYLGTALKMPTTSRISYHSEIARENYTMTSAFIRKKQDEMEAVKILQEGIEKVKDNDFDAALHYFNEALKIIPDHVDTIVARGAAFFHMKKLELSVADLERSVELKPDHGNGKEYLMTTLIHWGKKLTEEGDYDAAKLKFKRVLELHLNDRDALRGLANIEDRLKEVQVVKTVSAEERRREERKRKLEEEQIQKKKQAQIRQNREKLAEMESFIAALKKK